MRHPE
jgi:hypothetical protein